jgi:hypothetical protein
MVKAPDDITYIFMPCGDAPKESPVQTTINRPMNRLVASALFNAFLNVFASPVELELCYFTWLSSQQQINRYKNHLLSIASTCTDLPVRWKGIKHFPIYNKGTYLCYGH